MRVVVGVHDAAGVLERRQVVDPDKVYGISVTSRYLVSTGQPFSFGVSAVVLPDPEPEMLPDGRAAAGVVIAPSWDVSYMPTTRTLAEILTDVAAHGEDNPRHGTDCICMDRYIREVTQHVSKAIPPDGGGRGAIHSRLDARWRIAHVLQAVVRKL